MALHNCTPIPVPHQERVVSVLPQWSNRRLPYRSSLALSTMKRQASEDSSGGDRVHKKQAIDHTGSTPSEVVGQSGYDASSQRTRAWGPNVAVASAAPRQEQRQNPPFHHEPLAGSTGAGNASAPSFTTGAVPSLHSNFTSPMQGSSYHYQPGGSYFDAGIQPQQDLPTRPPRDGLLNPGLERSTQHRALPLREDVFDYSAATRLLPEANPSYPQSGPNSGHDANPPLPMAIASASSIATLGHSSNHGNIEPISLNDDTTTERIATLQQQQQHIDRLIEQLSANEGDDVPVMTRTTQPHGTSTSWNIQSSPLRSSHASAAERQREIAGSEDNIDLMTSRKDEKPSTAASILMGGPIGSIEETDSNETVQDSKIPAGVDEKITGQQGKPQEPKKDDALNVEGDEFLAMAASVLSDEEDDNADLQSPAIDESTWGEWDIPMGRKLELREYVGNVRFRELIEEHRPAYQKLPNKTEKTRLAKQILSKIKSFGGRILDKRHKMQSPRRDETEWYEVSDDKAQAKISQALRKGTKQPLARKGSTLSKSSRSSSI